MLLPEIEAAAVETAAFQKGVLRIAINYSRTLRLYNLSRKRPFSLLKSPRALLTTFSTVKPYFSKRVL